jgi:hypothetical protein
MQWHMPIIPELGKLRKDQVWGQRGPQTCIKKDNKNVTMAI